MDCDAGHDFVGRRDGVVIFRFSGRGDNDLSYWSVHAVAHTETDNYNVCDTWGEGQQYILGFIS